MKQYDIPLGSDAMTAGDTPIAIGDWCTWFHVPRGGWGRLWPVDALVKELRGQKAKIEVTLRHGARESRWVKIDNLKRWEQQPDCPATADVDGGRDV